MKKLILLKTFLIVTCIGTSVYGQNAGNRLWVTLNHAENLPQMIDGKLVSRNEQMNALIKEFSIVSFEQAVPSSRQEKLQRVYEVGCFCNQDELAEAMEKTTLFSDADRAPEYELLSTPNDYNLAVAQDYALDLINAEEAWTYTNGDTNVILGVSDGSYFQNHEDLSTEYVNVTNFTYASTFYYYHGTAVATTMAGATNNSAGKSSIGYNCRMDMRPIGYDYLLQMSYSGARVINVSWSSGCSYNHYFQDIIDEIYNQGTIIVAAAGNGGTCGGATALVYPAALDHVIAVSSVGPNDNHERQPGNPASTHQHNSSVDICAPGYDVALSIAPGWYMTSNGTSFAAPYVSGTIGLMLSLKPCLTFEEVLNALQTTAVNIDAQNPDYIGSLGAGRIDAGAVMQYVSGLPCDDGQVIGNGNGHGNGNGNGQGNGNNGGNDPNGDGNNGHGNDDGNFDPSNPGKYSPGSGGGSSQNLGGSHNIVGSVQEYISSDVNNNQAEESPSDKSNSLINENHKQERTNDRIEKEFEAVLFPNPSLGATKVNWNTNKDLRFEMYNSKGELIQQLSLDASDTPSIELNLEVQGVYYLHLIDETGIIWKDRFIKIE